MGFVNGALHLRSVACVCNSVPPTNAFLLHGPLPVPASALSIVHLQHHHIGYVAATASAPFSLPVVILR